MQRRATSAFVQQPAKPVVQVDDGAGYTLGLLFIYHLQRRDQPALGALWAFGGKRGHQLRESGSQVPVGYVLGTNSRQMRKRLE